MTALFSPLSQSMSRSHCTVSSSLLESTPSHALVHPSLPDLFSLFIIPVYAVHQPPFFFTHFSLSYISPLSSPSPSFPPSSLQVYFRRINSTVSAQQSEEREYVGTVRDVQMNQSLAVVLTDSKATLHPIECTYSSTCCRQCAGWCGVLRYYCLDCSYTWPLRVCNAARTALSPYDC